MKEPFIEETAISPAANAEGGSTFVAMRHRNYQLYFGGQLISNIGTWMQIIAQAWVVYQIGHSELTLGLVAFASAIPILLISPWGGVVVDRVSCRTLLMLTQSGAMLLAFVLAGLTFTNAIKEYMTGEQISAEMMNTLNIVYHQVCPQWNYTIYLRGYRH